MSGGSNAFAALIRPEKITGTESGFPIFKESFLSFVETIDEVLGSILLEANAATVAPPAATELEQAKAQRYLAALLFSFCDGDAKIWVANSPHYHSRNGAALWYELVREHEPKAAARRYALYQKVLTPPFNSSQSDVAWKAAFAGWEKSVRTLEDIIGRPIDEVLKICIVLIHVPEGFKTHLQMQSEQWNDQFSSFREKLMALLSQRRTFEAMDVDAEGGAAVNQLKFSGKCHRCGKTGHKASDCRMPDTRASGSNGASSSGGGGSSGTYPVPFPSHSAPWKKNKGGKGKGKESSKGKGKGKGKDKGKGKSKGKKRVRAVEDETENEGEDAYDWEEDEQAYEEEELEEASIQRVQATDMDVWEF